MNEYDAWAGMDIRFDVEGEVIYSRSEMQITWGLDRFAPPTDEERARGWAVRVIHLNAEQSWWLSTCSDCQLPLALHPDGRRSGSKRRYCREARKTGKMDE